jgi:hypothetical protein
VSEAVVEPALDLKDVFCLIEEFHVALGEGLERLLWVVAVCAVGDNGESAAGDGGPH